MGSICSYCRDEVLKNLKPGESYYSKRIGQLITETNPYPSEESSKLRKKNKNNSDPKKSKK